MATGSASLTNMSVNAAEGNQGLLMPKLQFRFRVTFSNLGRNSGDNLTLTRQVIDCGRPNVQFQEITLPVYNSTLYLAGKPTWQTIPINIRDDAGGAVSTAVGAQLQSQMDFAEQASASTGADYKFQTDIEILDGGNGTSVPATLEKWELYGCFIQTANYNTLNYGTNEAVTISLTLRFDNASCTIGNSSTVVGGLIGPGHIPGTTDATVSGIGAGPI